MAIEMEMEEREEKITPVNIAEYKREPVKEIQSAVPEQIQLKKEIKKYVCETKIDF